MTRKTVLVTGSSGKLGGAVAGALAQEHNVVQLDVRPPSESRRGCASRIHIGSVTDKDVVAAAVEGVDTIIHCAAIPWNSPPFDELIQINVGGTINLLEAAAERRQIERFIFISSIRVHGVLESVRDEFMPRFLPFDESHPYLTVEYYGGSKVQAEHWCRMYVKRVRKPVVVFRPSFIVPLPRENEFAARPESDRPDLNQYIATSDLVHAILLAFDYDPPEGFDAFLMHAADQCSTTPSLELAARWFPGVPTDPQKLALQNGYGALVDCSRARERLGWQPRVFCKR